MSDCTKLKLNGYGLSPLVLNKAAKQPTEFSVTQKARRRMVRARKLVDKAVADQLPVYGVTTGLGAKVTQALDAQTLTDFSYKTIRGRAHAVGEPVENHIVRAAMIVRLNTLLQGAAAATPAVADHLLHCLNANLTPVVGEQASIGAGDLVWNATMALSLMGEGPMRDAQGKINNAAKLMTKAGVYPPQLGPRDGLALCNNASYSAAMSALAIDEMTRVFNAAQISAALTMEGFQANLSPLDPRVLALRPQPGQQTAARQLLTLLKGSPLLKPNRARRLQDPLSIRNLAQIHGAVCAALEFANQAIDAEINGASDNPVALVEDQVIVCAGAYHTPHLTNAIETLSRSVVHLAVAQLARISKILSPRFSDLPLFLAEPGTDSNGFAPLIKTAESLLAEVLHEAQPVPIWPSLNADGVEDSMTATPTAARALMNIAKHSSFLCAIELLVAKRAIELRGNTTQLGNPMHKVFQQVDLLSSKSRDDHSLTTEIDALSRWVRTVRSGF